MFNVCPSCGQYSVKKEIDSTTSSAICPYCHYACPFLRQPLFIITGASGAGKTATCLALVSMTRDCVVLESDILWSNDFDRPEDNWRNYRNTWLRMAKNIGQSGRPVALFGTAVPEQFEDLPERRYFSTIHYLALVCSDEVLQERLGSRPKWREAGSPEFIEKMLHFNKWLKENASTTKPPIRTFDTSRCSVEESAEFTALWIQKCLGSKQE